MTGALRRIAVIAHLTTVEELRQKIFAATGLFAGALVYFGLVLTQLAQGFEERFFRDIGFVFIEFFGLAIILQGAYRVARQDVRKGSGSEMFFVRPIRRWEYLAGRFTGLACLLAASLAAMALIWTLLAAWRGFEIYGIYGMVFIEIFLKLIVVLAAAFFLAVLTTSQASYWIASFLIYASGHVMHLLRALWAVQAAGGADAWLLKALSYALPNFSFYSAINNIEPILSGTVFFKTADLGWAMGYSLVYGGCLMSAASGLFSRRELLLD